MSAHFICNVCAGDAFHEDDSPIDSEYNPDARRTFHFHTCPSCGTDDISEAFECEGCGEYTPEHRIETGTDLCIECALQPEPDEERRFITCRHP